MESLAIRSLALANAESALPKFTMLSILVLDGFAPSSSYENGLCFALELPLISLWKRPLGGRGFSCAVAFVFPDELAEPEVVEFDVFLAKLAAASARGDGEGVFEWSPAGIVRGNGTGTGWAPPLPLFSLPPASLRFSPPSPSVSGECLDIDKLLPARGEPNDGNGLLFALVLRTTTLFPDPEPRTPSGLVSLRNIDSFGSRDDGEPDTGVVSTLCRGKCVGLLGAKASLEPSGRLPAPTIANFLGGETDRDIGECTYVGDEGRRKGSSGSKGDDDRLELRI